MKRVLLFVLLFIATNYLSKAWSQCNSNVPVIFWPVAQNLPEKEQIPWAPDNSDIAPISIDGQVSDWQDKLLGSFTQNNNNPYNPPAYSAANWSQDGVAGVDDRDNPTSPRDLRFFAFTYDKRNVFFYFRRINNGTSQNSYYYFCDIMSNNNTVNGPDGYMNDGEPVFRVKFTNGTGAGTVEVLKYVVNTSAVGYVPGKGNPMVSSSNFADGYSMTGSATLVTAPVVPTGGMFTARETEAGYGVEFAIPWAFLKNYNILNASPIPQGNIFTYHVSLLNGSDNINNAQDNAGGCCAGVAASGNAQVTATSTTIPAQTWSSNTYYKTSLALKESKGAATKVGIPEISINDISYVSSSVDPKTFSVKVSKDDNNDKVPDAGTTMSYSFNSLQSGEYSYLPSSAGLNTTVEVGGTARFLIEVEMYNPGIKSFNLRMHYTQEIASTNSGLCAPQNDISSDTWVELITTPLPVSFSNFHAQRNKQTVAIKWGTATEQNNRGFNVQRNTKGVWENIAFVFSAADGGNSNSQLSYSYNDVNNEKGISQYRIQQVDIDGKASYSVIRSVKGEGQVSKTVVYPNPSTDGKVSVVFEDQGAKAVTVSDLSGRVVRQYRNVINNLQIEGLESGMYSIQITDLSSAASATEKVIIKKR